MVYSAGSGNTFPPRLPSHRTLLLALVWPRGGGAGLLDLLPTGNATVVVVVLRQPWPAVLGAQNHTSAPPGRGRAAPPHPPFSAFHLPFVFICIAVIARIAQEQQ